MTKIIRDEILSRLKGATRGRPKPRPYLPPLPDVSLSCEELVVHFSENIAGQTGLVYHVKDAEEARAELSEIANREGLSSIMVSTDAVTASLKLPEWGKGAGVEVLTAKNFANWEAYKDAVFNKVQAGVTGVDYAVAESGTICLIHDKDQPRLISIAPHLHIAVLPLGRLFAIYENVMDLVFADEDNRPSHLTLTTGPSMTADIQGGQFKGMHGPGKLIVMIIG
ncbi:MAG: hypothetical protein EG826_06905 [Deltaproteobacteria bacterium]|nr:hypothetical protein [Deltaproteobacteria bacterium]